MRTAIHRRVLLHTALGNLRAAVLRTRRTQIGKRRKRQILRNLPLAENLPECGLYIRRYLIDIRLAGNRNLETLLKQPVNALQRLIKTTFAAILVVARSVEEVQTHAEVNRVGVIQQRQHLMSALQ